jgi:hypothetical protein
MYDHTALDGAAHIAGLHALLFFFSLGVTTHCGFVFTAL